MIAVQKDWSGNQPSFDADNSLFACLSQAERAVLPGPRQVHVGVVSARRADVRQGIKGIVNVQAKLLASGARPRWYVDKESVAAYRRLGLDAVNGGKLTPARNKALQDAARAKKACVQVSDDISHWYYYKQGAQGLNKSGLNQKGVLKMANAAVQKTKRLEVSPMAAARFLLAKLRAKQAEAGHNPQLAGVYPNCNPSLGLLSEAVTSENFILGDFFIHDRSPCRFDESITLKEDYDFTCAHLRQHGSVLRCNRMQITAAHEVNAGGACSIRDDGGNKERKNIKILKRKWPGVFKTHGTRGDTQVMMRWKCPETAATSHKRARLEK